MYTITITITITEEQRKAIRGLISLGWLDGGTKEGRDADEVFDAISTAQRLVPAWDGMRYTDKDGDALRHFTEGDGLVIIENRGGNRTAAWLAPWPRLLVDVTHPDAPQRPITIEELPPIEEPTPSDRIKALECQVAGLVAFYERIMGRPFIPGEESDNVR